MKSLFSIIVLLGVLIGIGIAEDDKKKLFNDCKAAEMASDDDVQNYLVNRQPQNQRAKCFLACIYERSGVIKNGQIQPDAIHANILKRQKADVLVSEIIKECPLIKGLERCEQAARLKDCIDRTVVIRGLN